jgi:hypothetical protein
VGRLARRSERKHADPPLVTVAAHYRASEKGHEISRADGVGPSWDSVDLHDAHARHYVFQLEDDPYWYALNLKHHSRRPHLRLGRQENKGPGLGRLKTAKRDMASAGTLAEGLCQSL